jgi:hypothetical protein
MKNKQKKGEQTPIGKLTQNYEKFIKDKELNQNGKELFGKILKKATNPKQRGSK